jgi:hypothetical protein
MKKLTILNNDETEEVQMQVDNGLLTCTNQLLLIKFIRDLTGGGLYASKVASESLMDTLQNLVPSRERKLREATDALRLLTDEQLSSAVEGLRDLLD